MTSATRCLITVPRYNRLKRALPGTTALTPERCDGSPSLSRPIADSWKGHGMTISPKTVTSDTDTLWVTLNDGRVLGVPLAWFPKLLHASAAQRADFELSPRGIHWDALDEDISVEGLLAGHGDQTRAHDAAA